MEIEKKRETSWKIELRRKNENIELTSVEISGEVRVIKLVLINNENSIKVEMNKEEFFNFLSLISVFKDVVIGEDGILIEKKPHYIQKISKMENDIHPTNSDKNEKNQEKNDKEELNPEEWDPW
ncbi:MAG: hypothetical protein ACTSRI_09220 [Promethearchaeota archaeon]